MIDEKKHIEYWNVGSEEEMRAATLLLSKGLVRQGLFFCHLALEKKLKAHVVRVTHGIPPKIHNLNRLAELAELKLTEKQRVFLREFDAYQLEGRYPTNMPKPISRRAANTEFVTVKRFLTWLIKQSSEK
ncbi:MAG TPA: HEPN domain-containing protein [Candidatus Hydrogenedentes bacterium]|nr:HEPN domain-containing protein [Candidatus Hydrogenedentota bacterium]